MRVVTPPIQRGLLAWKRIYERFPRLKPADWGFRTVRTADGNIVIPLPRMAFKWGGFPHATDSCAAIVYQPRPGSLLQAGDLITLNGQVPDCDYAALVQCLDKDGAFDVLCGGFGGWIPEGVLQRAVERAAAEGREIPGLPDQYKRKVT